MEDIMLNLTQEAFKVTAMLASPLLVTSLAVGLLLGFFQAMTQVQEASLSFVPKVIVLSIVLIVLSPWMFDMILEFTKEIFHIIPSLKGVPL